MTDPYYRGDQLLAKEISYLHLMRATHDALNETFGRHTTVRTIAELGESEVRKKIGRMLESKKLSSQNRLETIMKDLEREFRDREIYFK